LKRRFILNGKQSRLNEIVHTKRVECFEIIDREISIATILTDGLLLAETLLSLEGEGALDECGFYAGGSTVTLLIITKLLGKELFIFNSFRKLPEVDEYNIKNYRAKRISEWISDWIARPYATRSEQVKANTEKYNTISVCPFHKR
jgi:hypothetical protein